VNACIQNPTISEVPHWWDIIRGTDGEDDPGTFLGRISTTPGTRRLGEYHISYPRAHQLDGERGVNGDESCENPARHEGTLRRRWTGLRLAPPSHMVHSVLVIDDNAGTRALLTDALRLAGYDTVAAENGAHGVRRLTEFKPCVILLDVNMPVMDGHDLHEVQKSIAPDVPVVCITGSATDEQAPRRVGASACYLKPIDIDALCATVADLCGRPHTHVERPSFRHPPCE